MMHPYFVATLLVGTVAVAYGAYIIYKEFSEEPILLHNTRGLDGYQSDESITYEKNGLRRRRKVKNEENDRNDEEEQARSISSDRSDASSIIYEKNGFRRRKVKNEENDRNDEEEQARGLDGDRSDASSIIYEKNGFRRRRKVKNEENDRNDEEEQELLDKYSYLTALEQEIERKKKQLIDEERILHEKEQEIQNRKQHLLSISSQSSSNTDNEISPLTTQRKSSISSSVTSASEIFVNDYHDKLVLTEGTLPVTSNPPQSVISVKTNSSEEDNQPINKFSDVAAHTILSQHLSHITHQQQTTDPPVIIQNSDTPADPKTIPSLISEHSQQHSYPVNNSHFVAKSVASEEAWSEVGSVLSENIGSVMSSAVDIDMEEVDVIEH